MEKGNNLNRNCTIWESTDGCCKQYRCGLSSCFLSLLSSNFYITIDKVIDSPGYGKYIVDAINTCDKRYVKGNIGMARTPKAEESTKVMESHDMVGKSKSI